MACYHPLIGYKGHKNDRGRHPLVFNLAHSPSGIEMTVPCGQCIGCRIDRSRQWAIRCIHEASLHEQNCFLTLTYDNEHLPPGGSLYPQHMVLFFKRLRKKYGKLRYFQCGEYGDRFARPHHHSIIFGFDFPDKKVFSRREGVTLYRSDSLDRLWGNGHCSIGAVTFQSAAYVARYIMKKVNGDQAEDYYRGRKPEYITMSRRPGIAADWFKKYSSDVYPKDFITHEGKRFKPPRFYDKLFDNIDPEGLDNIKFLRIVKATRNRANNTDDRLAVREYVQEAKLLKLKRSYESPQ